MADITYQTQQDLIVTDTVTQQIVYRQAERIIATETVREFVLATKGIGPRGKEGPQGPAGPAAVYTEIVANMDLTDDDDHTIFLNSEAAGAIDVDFSEVTPLHSFEFLVTAGQYINLLSIGTFYIAGQPVTGTISSNTIGSSARAIVVSATEIILQTFGAWEYE